MKYYTVFKLAIAEQLIEAVYHLHHVKPNMKERFEGMRVYYFYNDGTIDESTVETARGNVKNLADKATKTYNDFVEEN